MCSFVLVLTQGCTLINAFPIDNGSHDAGLRDAGPRDAAADSPMVMIELIESLTPQNGATDVSRTTDVRVVFTRAMAAQTFHAGTFRLETIGNPVSQTIVAYDEPSRTATLTVLAPLATRTSYTAVLTTGITELGGQPLPVEVRWSFTTADRTFEPMVPLAVNGPCSNPRVVIDSAGRATAVWIQGAASNLVFSRYEGVAWSAPTALDSTTSPVSLTRLSVDGEGNVLVAYRFDDAAGSGTTYAVRRYDVSDSAWEPEHPFITALSVIGYDAALGPDGTGATMISHQPTVSWTGHRYVGSDGWVNIGSANAAAPTGSRVGLDANGNIVASATGSAIFNRWNAGTSTWGLVTPAHAIGSVPEAVQLAVSSGGSFMLVWRDATQESIWARRWMGALDGEPIQLNRSPTSARSPQVAIDALGNAIAVWEEDDTDANGPTSVWANLYRVGDTAETGGWQSAIPLEQQTGPASAPQVAMNATSDAIAVWEQEDSLGIISVYAAASIGGAWLLSRPVETNDAGAARTPHVALGPDGTAVVVWIQTVSGVALTHAALLR